MQAVSWKQQIRLLAAYLHQDTEVQGDECQDNKARHSHR